jgi:hypothetical protein
MPHARQQKRTDERAQCLKSNCAHHTFVIEMYEKKDALSVAYSIILKFDGSRIIEGYSLEHLGTSQASWDDYQVRFIGNFNANSLNIIETISDSHSLKMTAQNNSVTIAS